MGSLIGKPVLLNEEGAKVLLDLFTKRDEIIKKQNEAYKKTKAKFDERKIMFQRYQDLELEYKEIGITIEKLLENIKVKRYNELFDLYINFFDDSVNLDKVRDFEDVIFEINDLLDSNVVSEYVFLVKRRDEIKEELFNLRGEVIKSISKDKHNLTCPHPMYAASNGKAYCVLCHKELEYYHDDFIYLDELVKSKRLIADIDYHNASYEGGSYETFYRLREIFPFEQISEYYRSMYKNKNELMYDGLISDDYDFEDFVFDHFCSERKPIVHKYRRKIY